MKHVHGISIRLVNHADCAIVEAPKPSSTKSALLRFNGRVGSCTICIRPEIQFSINIKLEPDFKIYRAHGIKVVVVAYTWHPQSQNLVQKHQLWWIAVDRVRPGAEYTLEGFPPTARTQGRKNRMERFLAPKPDVDYETTTANWVTEEHYCANKGCLAVFIERGRLCETLQDRAELRKASMAVYGGVKMDMPIPIHAEWFFPLSGDNGDPYIFEFRNMNIDAYSSIASSDGQDEEFGADIDTLVDSDSDNIYESVDGSELESEPEAEATDSDESSSEAESSNLDSSSDESEDTLPLPHTRKCPAARSMNSAPHKKAPTVAEKNAEANATSATFSNRDRDDEEVLPSWWKRERSIKPERASSSVPAKLPQRSSAGRGGNIIRMTPFKRT